MKMKQHANPEAFDAPAEAPSAPAPCFLKLYLVGMPPRCACTPTGHSREAPPPHPPGLHTCLINKPRSAPA